MEINITDKDMDEVVSKILKKLNSNISFTEIVKMSEDQAKAYFEKWQEDAGTWAIRDLVKEILERDMAKLRREVAQEIVKDLDIDVVKAITVDMLRDLIETVEDDDD